MPRTSDVYAKPAGTTPTDNVSETISAVPFNALMDDIVADLNLARPIVAGGTGATSAATALTSLGAASAADLTALDGRTTSAEADIVTNTADIATNLASINALGTSSTVDTGTASGEVALRSTDGHIPLYAPLLHIRDEKASGTASGTFTSGSWQTRDLNTVATNEIASASLSSNQISLPAGTYDVSATAPARAVSRHKAILYDVTNAANLLIGTTEYSEAGGTARDTTRSIVNGRIVLAGTTLIELRHRALTTGTYGVQSDFSVVEVYSEIQIRRVG